MSYLPGTHVCGCYQFSDYTFKLGNCCFKYFHFQTKKETTFPVSTITLRYIYYSMASMAHRQSTTMFPNDTSPVLLRMTQRQIKMPSSYMRSLNQCDTAAFWVYHALI